MAIFALAAVHASFVLVTYKQYLLDRRINGLDEENDHMSAADILGEP